MPIFMKFLLVFLLVMPISSQASVLYLESALAEYGPGDTFAADLYLDIGEECVNTIAAEIKYPFDHINVVDFIEGESIINLWVEKPGAEEIRKANESGALYFAGGMPGGYCGHVLGDPGRSNLVARVVFSIPGMIISDVKRDTIRLDFDKEKTEVFVNDGFGTKDKLETVGIEFKVVEGKTPAAKEWKKQISEDRVKPEPFVIEIRRDPGMFDNRFYAIFHTIDKQSGIDHYEILEARNVAAGKNSDDRTLFERFSRRISSAPEWKSAEMPYALEDQSLNSVIRIKAVDKAGNERFVEYIPPEEMRKAAGYSLEKIFFVLLLITAAVAFVLIAIYIHHRKKRKDALSQKEIQ